VKGHFTHTDIQLQNHTNITFAKEGTLRYIHWSKQ